MAKVAIMGYGTVGSGVYDIIKTNSDKLSRSANGESVDIKYILDIRDFDDHPEKELFTKEFNDILNDDEVSVVAEVMGGLHPAYEFTKSLLEAGKSVVTSNKELVATYGTELLEIARGKNVNYFFEASVGGGIPIIRPLVSSITSDAVTEITGILNGTTNYMLTKMSEDGLDYDAVLEDAQERGYAERNPAADVEGHDARRKIAILSSLAFGKYVDYEDVYTEGITKITSADFAYAKVLGSRIKLFGTSKKKDDGSISTMVCPVMITNEHPLFAVNDVMNAILVRGESMGDLMFYGAGAGKLPTASAVVADVVNAARNPKITEIEPYEPGKMTVSDHLKSTHSYFVRVKGLDANAVAESFKAKQIVDAGIADEFGLITAEWAENEFDALCENYPVVSVIRLAK